jgi:two-component system nitrate/nitrite sensor histidine kinase NarX
MAILQRYSLRLRLGLAMALIVAMSLMGMVSSLVIANLTQGAAQAINMAGSLRMQTYHLETLMLSGDTVAARQAVMAGDRQFQKTLNAPPLTDSVSQSFGSDTRREYAEVSRRWQTEMEPLLLAFAQGQGNGGAATARYAAAAPAFVKVIDGLVTALQNDTEGKTSLLRLIQGVGLFTTLVVVYLLFWAMHRGVLDPLNELLTAARRVGTGDFSYRLAHVGDDELGQLGHTLNRMSEELSKIYGQLEQRIRERTAELEQSNQSLELLYNVSKRLAEAPQAVSSYRYALQETERLMGSSHGVMCVAKRHPGGTALMLASSPDPEDARMHFCAHSTCLDCLGDGHTHIWPISGPKNPQTQVLSVPLLEQGLHYGSLSLTIADGVHVQSWQMQTVETVGRHLGVALGVAQRAAQERRIALLEERAAIARELHDSLAQSLSYSKIQVARLRACHPDGGDPRLAGIIADLGEGLDSAYRQLRELLTTFRLQLPEGGLELALLQTVDEFAAKSGIPIALNDRLSHFLLNANEEINILQIVREALANVEHHAHAHHAEVALWLEDGHAAVVRIDDDGVGLDARGSPAGHYGLAIMRERARSLGGALQVEHTKAGGTRVELQFTPAAYAGEGQSAGGTAATPAQGVS